MSLSTAASSTSRATLGLPLVSVGADIGDDVHDRARVRVDVDGLRRLIRHCQCFPIAFVRIAFTRIAFTHGSLSPTGDTAVTAVRLGHNLDTNRTPLHPEVTGYQTVGGAPTGRDASRVFLTSKAIRLPATRRWWLIAARFIVAGCPGGSACRK